MHDIATKLGFLDPVYVQYGRFLRQLVVGADFSTGPTDRALPGAVPGLLVPHPEPGAARASSTGCP